MRQPNRRPGFAVVAITLVLVTTTLAACRAQPTDNGNALHRSNQQTDPAELENLTVVIDPGHNGGNADAWETIAEPVDVGNGEKACDTTGTNTDNGYPEHEFNFDVADRLADLLTANGATVLLTRPDDDGVGPCITERTALANDARADVAVSIHADGGPPDGSGFHIMEPVPLEGHNEAIVEPSQALARILAESIETIAEVPPADYIGTDGINPRDDMGGLNLTTVPKVMVECGNMRHSGDAERMVDAGFRQQMAEALADGITRFLTD